MQSNRTSRHRRLGFGAGLVIGLACLASAAAAFDQFEFEPSWKPPSYESVRGDVLKWLDDADVDKETAESIRDSWSAAPPAEVDNAALLDRVVASLAEAMPRAGELRAACRSAYAGPPLPDASWLAGGDVSVFARNNLRLYYARWLAQYGFYDETLEQLGDMQPADVVDPASLLFYRMAAHHQVVEPDQARAALVQLMERDDQLPRRFYQVAQLVQRDLAALEDESLDHIARRMSDIRRRLGYGRAGEKVQQVERGVVESLDKRIEDLEKQARQQQQQAAAGSGRGSAPSQPMQDSRLPDIDAPMQVDRRDVGHQSGWGDLPPKEREQALQQIGREYPAHYRELIEQYFRELANEPEAPSEAAP